MQPYSAVENLRVEDCGLVVEFLLKTDSGYPKDTGVEFLSLAQSFERPCILSESNETLNIDCCLTRREDRK